MNINANQGKQVKAWMPTYLARKNSSVLASETQKITKVCIFPVSHKDIISRLKNSAFGKYYIQYLKRYSVIHHFVIWSWRNIYLGSIRSLENHLLCKFSSRERPVKNLSAFISDKNIPINVLSEEKLVLTPPPIVFPEADQKYLVSPHNSYFFPKIYVAQVKNAQVYGGTNLVLADNLFLCHDLYNFQQDYTSEELHDRMFNNFQKGYIRWLLHDITPIKLPFAACFVDACAPNYAHWLTEVLPRIAIFCEQPDLMDVPLIVNDGLHSNLMESLRLIAGNEREIITLPVGRTLEVDNLFVTSVTGYVPFERRNHKLKNHSHGKFSPVALDLLRNKLFQNSDKLTDQIWPEKIYLRRNSGVRNVINSGELEHILFSYGYVVVEPEKLNFLQQIQLFSHAKSIVGSSGAALANLIFASPTTNVVILISKQPETSYWYWQNMACALGMGVTYILGKPINQGIHSDFLIEPQLITEAIKKHHGE